MPNLTDRLQLEKELENRVDGMPTVALQILVEYATKLKLAYAAKATEQAAAGKQ